MLQKLVIRNYAIIDHLTIEPNAHFNTITGETGAGKSIMLGALSLILGERADSSVLINKKEKCVVEAFFDVQHNPVFRSAATAAELDDEPQCIIRREIMSSGKSRAFINDTPVTLTVLNYLTSLLVDLHQQFGHLALQQDHFGLDIVDAVAGNKICREEYRTIFNRYSDIAGQLRQHVQQQAQWQKEADYKQFLYDELADAAFKEHEIENAVSQLRQLAHSEKIMSALQTGRYVLEESEAPLLPEIRKIIQQLQNINDVFAGAQVLCERLHSVYVELKDVAGELAALEDSVPLDPVMMHQLQERIDLGYKLCKKHSVKTTAELLQLQTVLEAELRQTLHLSEVIEQLAGEQKQLYGQLLKAGEKLSSRRSRSLSGMVADMNALLHSVGMPNAQFDIRLEQSKEPDMTGIDTIVFLLDANKSGQFLPVYKAASGGEMSRIMLCLKSLTAQAMHLPTLIFDEVDTGISGEAARQVGALLTQLGRHHQVICITHQPQVAAKGSRHFYVFKESDNDRIVTRLRVLQDNERILAIARMIGGEQPTDAAIQNARELVNT